MWVGPFCGVGGMVFGRDEYLSSCSENGVKGEPGRDI